MAEGGLVTGPTMRLLGEQGPEAVIPLDRLGTFGAGRELVDTEQQSNVMLRDVRDILQRMENNPAVAFAEGGIITRRTRALVGERGPEMIVPLIGAGYAVPTPMTMRRASAHTMMQPPSIGSAPMSAGATWHGLAVSRGPGRDADISFGGLMQQQHGERSEAAPLMFALGQQYDVPRSAGPAARPERAEALDLDRMDRALGLRRNRRGNTGNIYAEVEFQREDDRTGGTRGKDPFVKLVVDNVRQAPLADSLDAKYSSWTISG
jgi:hypothetical protein